MHSPIQSLHTQTKEKYYKYSTRLEKNIATGRFKQFSRKKKNRLIAKVEKLAARLSEVGLGRKAAVAGSVAAGIAVPNLVQGQTSDLFYRRGNNPLDLNLLSGSKNGVVISNLDNDGDQEILISTTNGGYIFQGSDREGFDRQQPTDLGAMTGSFEVGDLDGDGDNDVVFVENDLGDFVTVLVNDGSGNLSRGPGSYSLSSATISGAIGGTYGTIDKLELADFDSDGDLDVLFSQNFNSSLYYFVNDGSGNFGPKLTISNLADNQIFDFEVADIDNDGVLRVIENTRDGIGTPILGGLNSIVSTTYGYEELNNITISDFDGDGDLDIFHSEIDGYGDGLYDGFLSINQAAQGSDFVFNSVGVSGIDNTVITNDAVSNDFDGDGINDLIIGQSTGNLILTFDGTTLDGTNQSINADIGNATQYFSHIAVGDIDGDGLVDLIGLDNVPTNDPYVYFDRAAPYFDSFVGDLIVDENNATGLLGTFSLTDANADPISANLTGPDASFFAIDALTGELTVNTSFDWESNGSFLDVQLSLSDGNKTSVKTLGLRVKNLPEDGQGVFENTSSLLLSKGSLINEFKPNDYDLDGDQDLFNSNGGSSIFQNTGIAFVEKSVDAFISSVDLATFTDLDDDGDLDVIGLSGSNLIFGRNESDSITAIDNVFLYGDSDNLISGDFDADGNDEVAVLDRTGSYTYIKTFELGLNNTISTSQNFGLEILGGGGYLEGVGTPSDIAIADFDGDGIKDLLVITEAGGIEPGDDVIFPGTGAGFSTTPSVVIPSTVANDNGFNLVEVGDIDGDGSVDIVSLRYTDASYNLGIDIHLNDGSGAFTLDQTITLGGQYGYSDFKLGDLDGDGSLDIAATIPYPGGSSVFTVDLGVFLNDPAGFTLAQTITDVGGVELELMDIENDDDLDIVLKEEEISEARLTVYRNINLAPTAIGLSALTFNEHIAPDTEVATLSVVDPNPNDTHVFALADGDGTNDANNSFFSIVGNSLRITRDVSNEDNPTLNINLSATDDNGNVYTQAFTLDVTDVNQGPTAIDLSTLAFDENLIPGSNVATISVTDPDAGDSHVLSLVPGAGDTNNNLFTIIGSNLVLLADVDADTNPTLSIRMRADDGNEFTEQAFTLTVNNVLGLADERTNELGIYPNPGKNAIRINIDNELTGPVQISVNDLGGRLIYSFEADKQGRQWSQSIDMTDAETGVYVVHVQLADNDFTQRWVKE